MVQEGYPEHYKQVLDMMGDFGGENGKVMGGFAQLHKSAVADGVLSSKTKELIALSIGICIRCDGCIAFHVHDAIKAGATHEEIVEAIGVAVLMGGGPAMVYGSQALLALKQFEAEAAAEAAPVPAK